MSYRSNDSDSYDPPDSAPLSGSGSGGRQEDYSLHMFSNNPEDNKPYVQVSYFISKGFFFFFLFFFSFSFLFQLL